MVVGPEFRQKRSEQKCGIGRERRSEKLQIQKKKLKPYKREIIPGCSRKRKTGIPFDEASIERMCNRHIEE